MQAPAGSSTYRSRSDCPSHTSRNAMSPVPASRCAEQARQAERPRKRLRKRLIRRIGTLLAPGRADSGTGSSDRTWRDDQSLPWFLHVRVSWRLASSTEIEALSRAEAVATATGETLTRRIALCTEISRRGLGRHGKDGRDRQHGGEKELQQLAHGSVLPFHAMKMNAIRRIVKHGSSLEDAGREG